MIFNVVSHDVTDLERQPNSVREEVGSVNGPHHKKRKETVNIA